jgi:dTMP kinase
MSNKASQGVLIVFEGTDGTGKSTQLQLLYDILHKKGYPVIATREPTDGKYGQKIRQLYKNRERYSDEEELGLFLADRKEHVETLLVPALNQGKIILCDRYFLSTAAYQGAIGFDPETVLARNTFAPEPDLALLFQVPIDIGLSRITNGRGEMPNDFEQVENLQKVAAIFAAIDRQYIRKIDASESIESVHRLVMEHISALFSNSPFPALD